MNGLFEMGTFPDDPELVELARKWDEAAYEFWKAYQKKVVSCKSAVLWLNNHENGHFMVFTRGEYATTIKSAIVDVIEELP